MSETCDVLPGRCEYPRCLERWKLIWKKSPYIVGSPLQQLKVRRLTVENLTTISDINVGPIRGYHWLLAGSGKNERYILLNTILEGDDAVCVHLKW